LSENPVNRKNTPLPKQLKPGEGETLTLLGEPRVFKVTPAENGGACLIFETWHASGAKIPLHAHREEDEAFFVLNGEFEFLVGPDRLLATAGDLLFVPRGAFHGFTTVGPHTGRLLVTVTPGIQHEGFFLEASELARRQNKPPGKAQLLGLTLKYGWVWP
jgi:quercetin dioxygenase-like cupin family protein